MEIYLNNWSDKEDVAKDFRIKLGDDINIILASYTYEDYSGKAFVLFEQDGKLFEINGGHCSCYGLEGQWEPEDVVLKELHHRLTVGRAGIYYGVNEYRDVLLDIVDKMINPTLYGKE